MTNTTRRGFLGTLAALVAMPKSLLAGRPVKPAVPFAASVGTTAWGYTSSSTDKLFLSLHTSDPSCSDYANSIILFKYARASRTGGFTS